MAYCHRMSTPTEKNYLSAFVDAVGANSTVPDRPDAIDLEIWQAYKLPDGEIKARAVGCVTLLRNPSTGLHGPWGDLQNWADSGVLEYIGASHDEDGLPTWEPDRDRIDEIVVACRDEIERAKLSEGEAHR